jgi:hypothetical protein
MSRTRARSLPIDVTADQLAALTAHVDAKLDAAKDATVRTPAVLRMLVLRPLADKLAKLDLSRQRRIAAIQDAFASFDAEWVKALAASPDTIGRLLDELAANGKQRIKAPGRSKPVRAPRATTGDPIIVAKMAKASSSPRRVTSVGSDPRDDGMAPQVDLWGEAR